MELRIEDTGDRKLKLENILVQDRLVEKRLCLSNEAFRHNFLKNIHLSEPYCD